MEASRKLVIGVGEPSLADFLGAIFEEAGWQPFVAVGEDEAQKLLELHLPAAVVTEWRWPALIARAAYGPMRIPTIVLCAAEPYPLIMGLPYIEPLAMPFTPRDLLASLSKVAAQDGRHALNVAQA